MVALSNTELDHVREDVRGASATTGDLPVLDIRIQAGDVEAEIQDIRVYVQVDVSEAEGWTTERARSLRSRIQDAVTSALHERYGDSAFSVTTLLQPRDSDAPSPG